MAAVLEPKSCSARSHRLDQAAICLSAACLVHCLGVPMLLVFAPWMTLGVLGEEWFHLGLVAFVVPLSLLAFHLGYRRHGRRGMLLPGLVGVSLVALAAGLEVTHLVGHATSAALTSVGGISLIVGHWLNLRGRAGFRAK